MKVINLKKSDAPIVKQYIQLRNEFIQQLNSKTVTLLDTLEWLKKKDIEVVGIVKAEELLGVGILYMNKNNEFGCFVKYPRQGIGTFIIKEVEKIASKKNIKKLWCQVNNNNAATISWLIKNDWNIVKREKKKVIFEREILASSV